MPQVVRLGDVLIPHGCFSPHNTCAGSGNVITNGIPTTRVGDCVTVHCCGPSCHDSVQASGSATVIVNGMPVARVGDLIACGSINGEGSANVIAG